MAWAKTKIKHMDIYIPNALNVSFRISAFEFEKDYICGHFAEAAAQVMIAALSLYEGYDPDIEWQDSEKRRRMLHDRCGIPVSAYIDYNKPLLTAQTVEVMVRYICENAVYDYDTREYRDFPMPTEASEILSYFDDVKLYFVGEDHFGGSGAASWVALKEDTFLWVRYSGLSD